MQDQFIAFIFRLKSLEFTTVMKLVGLNVKSNIMKLVGYRIRLFTGELYNLNRVNETSMRKLVLEGD